MSKEAGKEEPDARSGQTSRVGRLRGWFAQRREGMFYRPDDKNEFPQEVEDLRNRLRTDDPDLASEILAEAHQIYSLLVESRVESVESRSATLQGAVAVAASFVLTGGSLLLTQISAGMWRDLIGIALFFCITSLALCGVRATEAASQWRRWSIPPRDDILDRASGTLAEARVNRAVSMLRCAGKNSSAARWKVTMLRYAVSHLKRALLGLVAVALLIVIYASAHSDRSASSNVQRTPEVAAQPRHLTQDVNPQSSSPRKLPGQ